MKKKGFTLIELLAVIVVLAIIAIISVPIITSVIDKAKLGALKDSAYGIIDASELYLAKNMSTGITDTIEFTCSNGECLSGEERIDYKGNIKTGTLILTPSSKSLICIDNGKDYVLKLADDEKVSTGKGTCGEYEESNGTFNIVEATSARIEELESELNLIKNFLNTSNISLQFIYKGTNDEFEVPISGLYKIELWGAQGGNSYNKSKGAYVVGNIKLEKNQKIYIYVGGQGALTNCPSGSITLGGWNGGGNATEQCLSPRKWGSGGGATDIRLASGNWDNFDSLKSRIMVAAGGGGYYSGSPAHNGTAGGNLNGITGVSESGYNGYSPGRGATQVSGGEAVKESYTTSSAGYFGKAGNAVSTKGAAGGGSGYYGGGGSGHVASAGSGSSFISGYEGCNAISSDSTSSKIIHTNQPNHYSNMVFTNSSMKTGDEEMPAYNETGTMIGNTGDGFAKITLISID